MPIGFFGLGIQVRLYGQPLTQPNEVFNVPYASPAGVIAMVLDRIGMESQMHGLRFLDMPQNQLS